MSSTERPEGWPDNFSGQGSDPHCPHYYQWVDGQEAYKCIYCEKIRWEPPERKVDTEQSEVSQ